MFNSPFDPVAAMRVVSMVMMTVLIGVRVLPPLRRYGRVLSIGMLVVYFAAMAGFFLFGYVL